MASNGTVDKTKAHRSDDVPEPWLRQWDEQYGNWFYINPTTEPPTVSWYHPASLDDDQLAAAADAAKGAPPAYSPSSSSTRPSQAQQRVSQSQSQSQPQPHVIAQDDANNRFLGAPASDERRRSWGGSGASGNSSSGLGAGLAGGAGGLLLGSLLASGRRNHSGFHSGGLYGHRMGPPPFGYGGFGRPGFGYRGGFGRPYGYGGGCGPFGGGGFGGGGFGGPFGGGFGGRGHRRC
ncbi:hypothetical protein Q8F55_001059 [Vanrija albida]|uniref:WW domain-containing protein n=1 Tax=Vanrija albida TaxID=181172 RepID=A0ABR3QEZ5_9TREE